MLVRRLLIGLAMVAFASAAFAAEKRVPTDEGETLILGNWGANWVVGDPLPQAPAGTVTIHGPDSKVWRLTVAPLPPHPTLTGDPGNLRMYVRFLARGLENEGVQVEQEQKPIDGNVHGFFFKTHDARTNKSKVKLRVQGGDYVEGYTGAISINSRPYLFEVLWNTGGESAANAALSALKTARIQ